jgi:single-stranded DNA-binding protein
LIVLPNGKIPEKKSKKILIGGVNKGLSVIYFFSIVNNHNKRINGKWERIPHFFDFQLFGQQWEGASTWLLKGQMVAIQGYLEQEQWEKDSKHYSRLKITVEEINPLWPGYHSTEKLPENNFFNTTKEEIHEEGWVWRWRLATTRLRRGCSSTLTREYSIVRKPFGTA